ncbi:MAG: hypothetical protein JSV12_00940 [Candidatus Bathyarchaeota archaeon]|nr:MAG: hypothetical protein JSV12_00940 [Candidatus Bathyarchaeota archaeon]
MSCEQWSTNLEVRTQISAFLAGTFFAVLLVLVTQQNIQTLVISVDLHTILTIVSLTATFTSFVFSTIALGLSADCVRKGLEEKTQNVWEQRAKVTFAVGGDFFRAGYFCMMWSLAFVLTYTHWLFGIFGLVLFIVSWAFLCIKTGFPYKENK